MVAVNWQRLRLQTLTKMWKISNQTQFLGKEFFLKQIGPGLVLGSGRMSRPKGTDLIAATGESWRQKSTPESPSPHRSQELSVTWKPIKTQTRLQANPGIFCPRKLVQQATSTCRIPNLARPKNQTARRGAGRNLNLIWTPLQIVHQRPIEGPEIMAKRKATLSGETIWTITSTS